MTAIWLSRWRRVGWWRWRRVEREGLGNCAWGWREWGGIVNYSVQKALSLVEEGYLAVRMQ